MKKVTIIIPAFNEEKYISECIESIKSQTYVNFEAIIVDDGSYDDTIKIIKENIKSDKRFYLYKNEGKGVSSARNYGLSKAKGEYISFIDADDKISEKFIEMLVYLIEKNDCDCSSISVNSNQIEENNISNYDSIIFNDIEKYSILAGNKINSEGYVCNKLYKKKIIDKYELKFNEEIHIGEDLLFNNQYFYYSKGFVRNPISLYYYRLKTNSSVNRLDNQNWFDLLRVYATIIEKHEDEKILEMFKYNYALLILEAEYRIKYCNINSDTINYIYELKKKYIKFRVNNDLKKNIKLLLFRMFPNVAMKYKRRKVNK